MKKGKRRAGKDVQLVECVPSVRAAELKPSTMKVHMGYLYIPALRKV